MRSRLTSWIDCAADHAARPVRIIPFCFAPPAKTTVMRRWVDRFPYVPGDPARRAERCYEIYSIQVTSLAQRLRAAHIEKVVNS